MAIKLTLDGDTVEAQEYERLIDLLQRHNAKVPAGCYQQQLGPIQTCDTCLVEVNGKLTRACATVVAEGMTVLTNSPRTDSAQREPFDRILSNHMLYCTVCDNNNGNCIIHNTTKMLQVTHQKIPFKPKPYEVDATNPFYIYNPDQCVLCGRCVQACQNVEVNETVFSRLLVGWLTNSQSVPVRSPPVYFCGLGQHTQFIQRSVQLSSVSVDPERSGLA